MRIVLIFFLLSVFHLSNGQRTQSSNELIKEDYATKSKKQKTLYWLTGGTGLLLFTVGGIMYLSEFGDGLPGGTGYNEKTSSAGETLMYVGGGLVLVSVPFRIAYKRNEKIAGSLSFMNSALPSIQNRYIVSRFSPSLSLQIVLAQ